MKRTSEATATAKERRQEGDTPLKSRRERFDQDYHELLPKLMSYFRDDKNELALALGLNSSTVERWFNGKSRPNNSTILRMRSLAQERGVK
jgi:transcriptional regulator with XRE-family HTH domain